MHRRTLNRRHFLASTSALAAMAAAGRAPALAQPANARVLRYVPTGDPGSLDPIWTTNYETRNHGYLIYDTLFATGANFTVKPQMAEGAEVSADGKTCTIRLRDGLKFHDGEPVRARDCVASLSRWSKRDSFGQTWAAALDEMRASDDRTIVCRLKAPFPSFLQAIGKLSSNVAFIMPERVANTDAMQQITDPTGSGPFKFVRDELRPGSRLVYARNHDYVPRSDASDWAAGAKVAHFERIEWMIMPDAATSAAAIQTGEIDWLEELQPDTVPIVRRNRAVRVEIRNRLSAMPIMRFNQLHAPFNNVAIRRAIMLAVDQGDYTSAIVGRDPELSNACNSVFTCNTPLASEVAADPLKARSIERAREALARAGYNGEKVVLLSGTDINNNHTQAQVTNALLQRLGMNVEYVATTWSTIVQRRASREPGAWNIFHTAWGGADMLNPAVSASLRGNGAGAWFGWPDEPRLEALRSRWFLAADDTESKRIAEEIQTVAFETVPFIPLGQIYLPAAVRTNLAGIIQNPVPFFWNVRRA